MESRQIKMPTSLLLPAMLGTALCIAIFYIGWFDNDNLKKPEFLYWLITLTAIFILNTIFIPVWWFWYQKNASKIHFKWKEGGINFVLVTLFYAIPYLFSGPIFNIDSVPMPYFKLKLYILVAVTYLMSMLPACFSIWMLQSMINSQEDNLSTEEKIQQYISNRSDLNLFLGFIGAIESLLILTIAELRQILLGLKVTTETIYPSTLVLLVSALYTLILVIIIFPIYWDLIAQGRKIIDDCYHLPPPEDENWEKIYQKRQALEAYLELDISPIKRIEAVLPLAAPLLSGLLSSFLEKIRP